MSQNQEIAADGSFKRQKNQFTTPFGNHPGDTTIYRTTLLQMIKKVKTFCRRVRTWQDFIPSINVKV
jgi:hypothetical protein